MNGKKKVKKSHKVAEDDENDPEYRPRQPRGTLSEESADDFEKSTTPQVRLFLISKIYAISPTQGSRKRKLLVVHNEEGSDNDMVSSFWCIWISPV
jgi:hypothetical protein